MASQDEIQRLWRINRTCSEMLKDRGYLVPDEKLTLTLDQFKEDYGVGDATREGMTMVVPKMSDPQDQVPPARRPLTALRSCEHCQQLLLRIARLPCGCAALFCPVDCVDCEQAGAPKRPPRTRARVLHKRREGAVRCRSSCSS